MHPKLGAPCATELITTAGMLFHLQVSKLAKNEVLMLNIGSMCTGARVIAVSAAA